MGLYACDPFRRGAQQILSSQNAEEIMFMNSVFGKKHDRREERGEDV